MKKITFCTCFLFSMCCLSLVSAMEEPTPIAEDNNTLVVSMDEPAWMRDEEFLRYEREKRYRLDMDDLANSRKGYHAVKKLRQQLRLCGDIFGNKECLETFNLIEQINTYKNVLSSSLQDYVEQVRLWGLVLKAEYSETTSPDALEPSGPRPRGFETLPSDTFEKRRALASIIRDGSRLLKTLFRDEVAHLVDLWDGFVPSAQK